MTKNMKKYGIIGDSLGHSLSPQIHNHFFRMHNLSNIYEPYEADVFQLADIMKSMRKQKLIGLNITFPYKEVIIPFLDRLHKSAMITGAVNTIKNINGILTGYNTDVHGVRSTLNERMKINLNHKTVSLLGAGGAARACMTVLGEYSPAKIIIFNRTVDRAELIVSKYAAGLEEIAIEIKRLDDFKCFLFKDDSIIINALSMDASDFESILKNTTAKQKNCIFLFDLNYGYKSLAQESRRQFKIYEDGLYMLSAQAAESFRIWTDISISPDEIYRYVHRKMERHKAC